MNPSLQTVIDVHDILYDVASEAEDVEHYLKCHADTLPELLRKFSKAIIDARMRLERDPLFENLIP